MGYFVSVKGRPAGAGIALMLSLGAPVHAQETKIVSLPVSAVESVAIPDLSGGTDPAVVRNGWKYFYFWRANTSYTEAYADFAECYRFTQNLAANTWLPGYAPWRRGQSALDVPADTSGGAPSYGLVGYAIGAIVAGPLVRRAYQSRLRRCMEPKGYARYPLQELRWETLTDNFSQASIAMQAKAASGAKPDGQALPGDR